MVNSKAKIERSRELFAYEDAIVDNFFQRALKKNRSHPIVSKIRPNKEALRAIRYCVNVLPAKVQTILRK